MADTKMQLEHWLDDLCVRFIVNLPDTELSSVERICFSIEEAQWYYEDFIRPLDPSLPSLTLRNFSMRIFTHCPLLAPFSKGDHMRAFDEFLKYKTRIPVRGAILMNDEMDSAILVKGWKKGANWSFPRGKINWAEDDLTCAIREVYEETGYDVEAAGLVPEDRQVKHIDITMHDQQMRLYVFRDVPMDTHFEPRTRKEISKIQWWRLSDLPAYRKKGQHQQDTPAISPNKFYMVAPFLPHLRKWVIEQKKQDVKRATSYQHPSAGISHDEILTEEDQGMESNTHGAAYPTPARKHIDTLEGTNEALRALLKIKPLTQGFEGVPIQVQPVSENKGGALLAFLQGTTATSNHSTSSNALPQTPLEHSQSQAPQLTTAYHPLQPNLPNLPPLATFRRQAPNLFSYQEQTLKSNENSELRRYQQQNLPQVPQRPPGNPHLHQNQNLVHPQPLPPHVQKAVFTGGPVHSPMVSQPVQEPFATRAHYTSGPTNPQFPGLHAPMVASVQTQPQPKLNSHALALLNAFKSRDQANGATPDSDLPLRRFMEEPAQPPSQRPHELPAEVSMIAEPVPQYTTRQSVPLAQQPSITTPNPKPISEQQRSALLGLFKSPTIPPILPVTATVTALPVATPISAVELSAVDTLSSNAARTSPVVGHKEPSSKAMKDTSVPKMNPETNLPFRAMKILARPTQVSDSESQKGHTPASKSQSNGKRPASRGKVQQVSPHEKPFQPQILKRQQPGTLKGTEASVFPSLSTIPTKPVASAGLEYNGATANNQKQILQSLFSQPSPASSKAPQFDRRPIQSVEHKQTLLSLFGAPSPSQPVTSSSTEDSLSQLFSIDPTQNSGRPRMGSLASADATSRRSSQTPMSPADKGFLLSYLDSVTKGVQR